MADIVKVGTLTVKLNVEPIEVLYDGKHFMSIAGGKETIIRILAEEVARLREQLTEER